MALSSNGIHDEDDLDIDFSDIEQKYAPRLASPLDSAVLVDGAPIVGPDKRDKLLKALQKTFDSRGFRLKVDDMDMPVDDNNQSMGYLFVVFSDPSVADQAARTLNGHAFDKRHTLAVMTFAEVERVQTIEGDWEDLAKKPFEPREHHRSWLGDDLSRDQLFTLRGDQLTVAWLDRKGTIDPVETRNQWTDLYASWSPLGTVLATVHNQGVALWGGPSFGRIHRFAHPNVKLIDFSPNEKYMVTWSPTPISLPPNFATNPNIPFSAEDEGNEVVIWETFTGKLMRTFSMLAGPAAPGISEEEAKKRTVHWPMFKWSGDERYFARVTAGQQISIYQTPSMGLLDKKSIKIDGVVDFEWAPMGDRDREHDAALEAGKRRDTRESVLAYWVPEIGNQPARVTLMGVPSRATLRSKNLFNVSECKIFWQSAGDYLCIKVDRHTRSKKTIFTNLEVFRLRDKAFPVETIEVKDAVTDFAWEPKGDRFAMLTSNDPMLGQSGPGATIKTSLSFYQLDTKKGDFRLLRTFDNKTSTSLIWSPKGRHVVAATLGSTTKSDVEFWDLELDSAAGVAIVDRASANRTTDPAAAIALITTVDHYGATAVDWDPSGRYVGISGTIWQSTMEAGYGIYDFRGNELDKHQLDKFKQLLFRPRPPTLLSKEEQDNVRRNFKEYSRRYDEIDTAMLNAASSEVLEQRRRAVAEWNAWRQETKARVAELAQEMDRPVRTKRLAPPAKDAVDEIEEWVEEVISEETEIVQ